MRVFRFVPLALAVLLTGCLGGDVSRVKDSKLKGWPQYTVGQLLDKRQVCSSTKWHSFTDKRDRKIVEYVCDYAPAKAYLQESTEKSLVAIQRDREFYAANEKTSLEDKRKKLDEAIAFHEQQLAKKELLEQDGSQAIQLAERDFEIMRSVKSCAGINPEALGDKKIQARAILIASDCTPRTEQLIVQELAGYIKGQIGDRRREKEKALNDSLRYVTHGETQVRVLKQDLEESLAKSEKSARGPDSDVPRELRLQARLTAFQGVREVSQWTLIDGEPTYLGSRVDVLFENQPIEVPVDALFVFNQAADDPAGLTPLYEYLLQRMFAEFKAPSEK